MVDARWRLRFGAWCGALSELGSTVHFNSRMGAVAGSVRYDVSFCHRHFYKRWLGRIWSLSWGPVSAGIDIISRATDGGAVGCWACNVTITTQRVTHVNTAKHDRGAPRSPHMKPDAPAYQRVFELPARWGCDLEGAFEDMKRHGLPMSYHAANWRIEWGTWRRPGGIHGLTVANTQQVMPDPIPFEASNHLVDDFEGDGQARDGAVWSRHLSPRSFSGTVALFRRDAQRLLDAATLALSDRRDPDDSAIKLREVDGTPAGKSYCGRVMGTAQRVTLGSCFILADDLGRFERRLGISSRPSPPGTELSISEHRVLLESLLDADHPSHAWQLALAVRAWRELFFDGGYNSAAGMTQRQHVVAWLERNASGSDEAVMKRIATLINPNPAPGRPRKQSKG